VARHLAIDEQGTLLRATWRPDHGFVNLSLWRGDTCAETFHMTPDEAAALMSFLAHALADGATPAVSPPLRLVADQVTSPPPASRRRTARPRPRRVDWRALWSRARFRSA
jgi:hypothetical protein